MLHFLISPIIILYYIGIVKSFLVRCSKSIFLEIPRYTPKIHLFRCDTVMKCIQCSYSVNKPLRFLYTKCRQLSDHFNISP